MADVNHVVDDCIGSEGCGALGQMLRGLCGFAHKGAPTDSGLYPAATLQLGVGRLHGEARDAQLLRHGAHGGQLRAWWQCALGNQIAHLVGNLAVERDAVAALEAEVKAHDDVTGDWYLAGGKHKAPWRRAPRR